MKTVEERFWEKVEMIPESTCWHWLPPGTWCGYGLFRDGSGKKVSAHRFSYRLHKGEIPKNMCVLHVCDQPSCVNPAHLVLGSHTDNMRDMANKKRHMNNKKTHCNKGHAFTHENTRIYGGGKRACRACDNSRPSRYKKRRRA